MIQIEQELQRLNSATKSYGDEVGPFDAAMREYMMRSLDCYFVDGGCLQIGCAHGDQTSRLLMKFNDLTVLEPVDSFIQLTKARVGGSVHFENALIETFETEKRYANIVFSHVIEHVEDPIECLKRLSNLLSPKGRLFIVAPNAEAPSRRIAVKMGILGTLETLSEADIAAEHRRVYRMDTLLNDVRKAELTVIASGGIFYKPLANFQFDALIGTPLISEAFLEGCYQLGFERPTECASLFVVAAKSDT